MVAIKDFDMPKGCWYSTNLKMSGVTTCPLKSYCSEKHIKETPLDTRPSGCPLVEIGTCKDCKHFHNVRKDFNTCDLWTIACADNHYCTDFEKRGSENDI